MLGVDAAGWPFPFGYAYGNLLGNILASIICAAAIGVWAWRKFIMCDQPRCWRIHHLDVHGTTYRTCRVHVSPEEHDALRERHARIHPRTHAMVHENHRRQAETMATVLAPTRTRGPGGRFTKES